MLEKILIFIIFLGPLVFFHELGHFLFARLFGVRVEVFSLGFGPKIFKRKWGDTEYCVSAIPLGGYVKMFGDDPFNMDAVGSEERKHSFTHKGKWARFWIVMGGPLANFVLAYFLFVALFVGGEKVPELRVGMIPESSMLYQAGLRPGDAFREFNGKPVLGPTDIALEGTKPISSVVVKRTGERVELKMAMTSDEFFNEFIKYPPTLRKPYLVDARGKSYLIFRSDSKLNVGDSLDQIALFRGEQSFTIYEVPEIFDEKNIENHQLAVFDQFTVHLEKTEQLLRELRARGFYARDLLVRDVLQGGPAYNEGLRKGDILKSVSGSTLYSFEGLIRAIDQAPSGSLEIEAIRDGEVFNVSVTPEVRSDSNTERRLIGIFSSAEYVPFDFINTEPKGVIEAFYLSFGRTWDVTMKTLEGFKMLFTAQVSLKSIGGPIAIGQVASDSFNTSITYFFQLMALISINLGLINLLPIPVLDGGHIMFIILETINRGPISRRKMEIAQQVGLSLLLILMIGALFNDFSRLF
jgi:regulator of sigma E protease